MSSAGTDGPDEAEPEPAVGPQPLSSPGAAGTMAASLGRPPGPSPPGGRLAGKARRPAERRACF